MYTAESEEKSNLYFGHQPVPNFQDIEGEGDTMGEGESESGDDAEGKRVRVKVEGVRKAFTRILSIPPRHQFRSSGMDSGVELVPKCSTLRNRMIALTMVRVST